MKILKVIKMLNILKVCKMINMIKRLKAINMRGALSHGKQGKHLKYAGLAYLG
jgi:hypothetical protein